MQSLKPIYEYKHVYFMGIGGVSMSGLAMILMDKGHKISGSDRNPSEYTDQLEALGAKIYYGQKAENITDDIDLVVYTAAIHPDNPEYQECLSRKLPMMNRAVLLGQIMAQYESSISVAGTHGKTTTTSMISEILIAADSDPTISNGGILRSINTNTRIGHSPYFVAEACEYTNSFHEFYPRYSVVLNIEEDHLDFFKDLDDIRASFRKYMDNTSSMGALIVNGEIENLPALLDGFGKKVVTFGIEGDYEYHAEGITYKDGLPTFALYHKDQMLFDVTLALPGRHNVSNAMAAIALCITLGIPKEAILEGLAHCLGSKRRFEKKGELPNGAIVLDDYAHHPTEIKTTLTAARAAGYKRIVCVFQSHTYTRTKALFNDFVDALSLADLVVIAKIYPARETDNLGISGQDLTDALIKKGVESYYFDEFAAIEKFLLEKSMHGDLLITMGAGNVVEIGENILR